MGLADVFGTAVTALAPAAQAYFNAQAARSLSRSGVPTSGGFAGGGFGGYTPTNWLGDMIPGTDLGPLEAPGTMERWFGNPNERAVTLWAPPRNANARPIREIYGANPISGAIGVWKYAGRPILYSGDIAACKRVNRIAARASRGARRAGVVRRRTRTTYTTRRRARR